MNDVIYSKDICYFPDNTKLIMRLLSIRGVELIDIRKHYLDFDGITWMPTKDGIRFTANIPNMAALFDGLVDILSKEEVKKYIVSFVEHIKNEFK